MRLPHLEIMQYDMKAAMINDKSRDIALDMLKGLCILLVVYGHLPRTGYLHENLESLVKFIYTFHMPVFVLLSGFFFARHSKSVGKVASRIVKPYLAVALAFIPLLYAVKRPPDATLWSMFLDVFAGHAGGALWYLYDLAIVELLAIGGVYLLGRVQRIAESAAWECFCVAITVAIGCLVLNLNGGAFVRLIPVWFWLYFLIGYVCGKTCREFPASVWGIGGMVLSVFFLHIGRDSCGNYVWVLSLLAFSVWFLRKMKDKAVANGLSYMGRHSLAILLFHPVFNHVVNPVFTCVLRVEGSGIAVGLLSLAANVALCLALETGIKRTPLARIVF